MDKENMQKYFDFSTKNKSEEKQCSNIFKHVFRKEPFITARDVQTF